MATWTHLTDYWEGRSPRPRRRSPRPRRWLSARWRPTPARPTLLGARRGAPLPAAPRSRDRCLRRRWRSIPTAPTCSSTSAGAGLRRRARRGHRLHGEGDRPQPVPSGAVPLRCRLGPFVARRYQAAIDVLALRTPPTTGTHEPRALCYAMLGREAEARRAMALVLAAKPRFSVAQAAAIELFAREEDFATTSRPCARPEPGARAVGRPAPGDPPRAPVQPGLPPPRLTAGARSSPPWSGGSRR